MPGICGGEGTSCLDCADVPNGPKTQDRCGVCDADQTNDCTQVPACAGNHSCEPRDLARVTRTRVRGAGLRRRIQRRGRRRPRRCRRLRRLRRRRQELPGLRGRPRARPQGLRRLHRGPGGLAPFAARLRLRCPARACAGGRPRLNARRGVRGLADAGGADADGREQRLRLRLRGGGQLCRLRQGPGERLRAGLRGGVGRLKDRAAVPDGVRRHHHRLRLRLPRHRLHRCAPRSSCLPTAHANQLPALCRAPADGAPPPAQATGASGPRARTGRVPR